MTLNKTRSSAGFSLVEMMISMILGLILIGGILTMYLSSKRTMYTTEASSQIQETARFALDRISFDVRMSGFWGCLSTRDSLTSALKPSANWLDLSQTSIGGTDNDGLNSSDSVSVALAAGPAIDLLAPMSSPSASLTVSATSGLEQGDVVVVNDCSSADLFQIDGSSPHISGTLFHDADGPMVPGNIRSTLAKAYDQGAEIYRIDQVTWSLGNDEQGQPTLMRNGEPLVRGVENLQVAYGVDSNGDASTDHYVDADAVTDWASVMNIKLGLLIRSEREVIDHTPAPIAFWGQTMTPNDGYLRRSFTAVISIRNRLS